MSPEPLGQVVAHAGHDASMGLDVRLALGALAGLVGVLALSPLAALSADLREAAAAAATRLLRRASVDITPSSAAAVLLGAGLLAGALFELVVVGLERVRPIVVVIGGRVTLTDLVAVAVVSGLAFWCLRRSARDSPNASVRSDSRSGLVFAVSLAYGVVVLLAVSGLHTFLTPV